MHEVWYTVKWCRYSFFVGPKTLVTSKSPEIKLPCSSLVGWWGAWTNDLQKVQSSSATSLSSKVVDATIEEKLPEFENEHFIYHFPGLVFHSPKLKNSSWKIRDGKLFKTAGLVVGTMQPPRDVNSRALKASVLPNTPTQQISDITVQHQSFNKKM